MIALLFVAFLVYLYAPHLVFKFAARGKYDLVTRKDLPQVEEFFAAALPSALLNAVTWLSFLLLPKRVPIIIRGVPDRKVLAKVFAKDPDLSNYFAAGDLRPLFTYIAMLFLVAWACGRLYGRALRAIARAGGTDPYLAAATGFWVTFGRVLTILYRKLWRPFYAQDEQPLYPQVLQESYAFVHTNHGLYHGVLYQYEKRRDGDLEGIYIVNVSRFSRRKEKECLEAGENPISQLNGPLFITWSDILDINFPPSAETLENKRREYEKKLQLLRGRPGTQ